MRPLRRRRGDAPPRDPAPSRWGYRFQRLMLTPMFRLVLRVGVPVFLLIAVVGGWLSIEANRIAIQDQVIAIREKIQNRPEFQVGQMEITGADAALSGIIRAALPVEFPVSSFALDLQSMRESVVALPAVDHAVLRIGSGGVLQIEVAQRIPVALWRDAEGLKLIDASGIIIGATAARADRPDLPLVAGDGAPEQIDEALALYAAGEPLGLRLRGLVRVGERRWDLMLDRGQRILLPASKPVRALERVLALNEAQDMLERDISIIDMRNAARPTIRLNPAAMAELRRITAMQLN